jgi:hypothetical protein
VNVTESPDDGGQASADHLPSVGAMVRCFEPSLALLVLCRTQPWFVPFKQALHSLQYKEVIAAKYSLLPWRSDHDSRL